MAQGDGIINIYKYTVTDTNPTCEFKILTMPQVNCHQELLINSIRFPVFLQIKYSAVYPNLDSKAKRTFF